LLRKLQKNIRGLLYFAAPCIYKRNYTPYVKKYLEGL